MDPIAIAAAVVAAPVHAWFFALESLWFMRPTVWRRFGLASEADAAVVRLVRAVDAWAHGRRHAPQPVSPVPSRVLGPRRAANPCQIDMGGRLGEDCLAAFREKSAVGPVVCPAASVGREKIEPRDATERGENARLRCD